MMKEKIDQNLLELDSAALAAAEYLRSGRWGYRIIKRAFDIVFSACVLVVGFVPGLVLSAFIVRDTGASSLYTQERVGKGGKTFRIYKFRTMVADSDNVEKYLSEEQLAQWRSERKVDDDPRITPLGRRLRRLSLDELPNFINVLKWGSFVKCCFFDQRPIYNNSVQVHA